jgi:hypothetical protein
MPPKNVLSLNTIGGQENPVLQICLFFFHCKRLEGIYTSLKYLRKHSLNQFLNFFPIVSSSPASRVQSVLSRLMFASIMRSSRCDNYNFNTGEEICWHYMELYSCSSNELRNVLCNVLCSHNFREDVVTKRFES